MNLLEDILKVYEVFGIKNYQIFVSEGSIKNPPSNAIFFTLMQGGYIWWTKDLDTAKKYRYLNAPVYATYFREELVTVKEMEC